MWGYQGTPDIPIIIDDGTSNILYDLFDTDGGYPDNIFIDHNMNVYNITELEMDESSINNIIQSMLDEIPTSVSYEDDIQPIFNQHCTSCHGNSAG